MTLDLTFLQQDLHGALLSCEVRRDLHYGSDHLPVAISIGLEVEEVEERLRRAWKSADPEEVAKLARETSPGIPKLCLRDAVDSYLRSILDGINTIAEKAIPMAKQNGPAHSFWNW